MMVRNWQTLRRRLFLVNISKASLEYKNIILHKMNMDKE